MIECPCKDCSRRCPHCHGECEEYADWKQERQRENLERRPPQTQGFWDWKSRRPADTIKNRGRSGHGENGDR